MAGNHAPNLNVTERRWICNDFDGSFQQVPIPPPIPATGKSELPFGMYRPTHISTIFGKMLLLQPHKPVIADEPIILVDAPVTQAITGILKFWSEQEKFKRFGLVHKRGILFHGEPGSGKSVAAQQIADFLVRKSNGFVLVPQFVDLAATIDSLKAIRFDNETSPILVLFEDLEWMIASLGGPEAILNLMDGQEQVGNIVFVATTNNIDALDSRLTKRPSRFDEVLYITKPNAESRRSYMRAMLERAREKYNTADLESLVQHSDGLMISHLRELVVSVFVLGRPLKETVDRLLAMVPPPEGTEDYGYEETTGRPVNKKAIPAVARG